MEEVGASEQKRALNTKHGKRGVLADEGSSEERGTQAEDVLSMMPRTLKIFSRLLKRAEGKGERLKPY